MSLLSGVLPQVQAISEDEMLDTVTIRTSGAVTANSHGAMVPGTETVSTTKGRITALNANDVEHAVTGTLRLEGLEKLTVPLTAAITGKDTVKVVSARHRTTREYTVEGVLPASTFAVHRKVLVRAA